MWQDSSVISFSHSKKTGEKTLTFCPQQSDLEARSLENAFPGWSGSEAVSTLEQGHIL